MRIVPLGGVLALALAFFLPGCQFFGHSDAGVSFFTEPPGASVIVDHKDSGFVTPCRLSLRREEHQVELAMPGYATASLNLLASRQVGTVYWRDMSVRPEAWRFPLWLNLEDTVEPVKVRATLAPGHVFVRLQRATQP